MSFTIARLIFFAELVSELLKLIRFLELCDWPQLRALCRLLVQFLSLTPIASLALIRANVGLQMLQSAAGKTFTIAVLLQGTASFNYDSFNFFFMAKMRLEKNSLCDGKWPIRWLTDSAEMSGCSPWRFNRNCITRDNLGASSTTVGSAFRTSHRTTELSNTSMKLVRSSSLRTASSGNPFLQAHGVSNRKRTHLGRLFREEFWLRLSKRRH